MKRWFQGRLEGHYVGRGATPAAHAGSLTGQRYRFEIYRAVIRSIELKGDTPEPVDAPSPAPEPGDAGATPAPEPVQDTKHHHVPIGRSLHQPHIGEVRFVDAHGPGRSVLAAAYDVLASDLSFSHPARHGTHTYGRIEATVSGWFRPPPALPPPPEVAAPAVTGGPVWKSRELEADPHTSPLQEAIDTALAAGSSAQTIEADDPPPGTPGSAARPLAQPLPRTAAIHPTETAPAQPPLLPFATLIAIALAFSGSPSSAAVWAACVLPAYGLRRWLTGVVPDAPASTALAIALACGQLFIAGMLITALWRDPCHALSLGPVLLLIAGLIVASVLPRAYPFALTALALAAVLFAYYGPLRSPTACANERSIVRS